MPATPRRDCVGTTVGRGLQRADLPLESIGATGVCGVTDPESSPVLPPLGAKPSLVAASTAAQRNGRSEGSSIRMLDAIGSKPHARGKQRSASPTGWLVAALIAVAAVSSWWWLNRDAAAPSADEKAENTATSKQVAAGIAATSAGAAPAGASSGSATIERTVTAVSMALPDRQATDKLPAPPPASMPASFAIGSTSRPATAATKPDMRPAVAGPARSIRTAVPPLSEPSRSDASGSRDADVTLLTAMLARISRDVASGQITQVNATVAPLVAKCEAHSADDPIGAFECKRQVCADFWGRVDACPRSLAPKAP